MKRVSFRRARLFITALFLTACSSGLERELPTIEEAAPSAGVFETLAATNGTLTVGTVNSVDDAEETNSSGAINLTNTALTLGAKSGAAQTVGLRFQNLGIPKGATITSAFLEVRAAAASSAAATFTIKGELIDSTGSYTTAAKAISSRAKTVAGASWTPAAWTTGTAYRSVDLKGIVKEIVDRPGWYQGNSLALQLTGANTTSTRSVVSFNSAPANAPKLIVAFTYDPVTSPAFLSRGVGASSDDAEQPGTGAALLNSTVLELGQNGATAQTVGLRFPNLTIPPGATINSAVIELTSTTADTSATNYTVTAEASDAAAPFTTVANSVGARSRLATPAPASWRPGAFQASTNYRTVPLTAYLQEVVKRPGWRSGNAAAFFIAGTGTRKAVAFDGTPATAPRLIVSYTPTATPPPPTNPCSSLNGVLPAPWTGGDVGTVSAAGKAGSATGVFDLCGYGAGLGATTDSFQYVRQTLNGDGTLTARLTGLDAATTTARAGVMVRETTTATAKYAALYIDGANAKAFVNRGGMVAATALEGLSGTVGEVFKEGLTTSDSSNSIFDQVQGVAGGGGTAGVFGELGSAAGVLSPQASQITAPVWLRLTRKGAALSAYTSADGQTWTPAGTTTLTMGSSVQVGLFSTGQGSTTPATAKFDGVTLGPVVPSEAPPVAAVTATPTSGNAPLAVSFNGSASQRAYSYAWDFNATDGITAEAQGPTATTTYSTPGTYTATLTVTDVIGRTSQATAQITVNTTDEAFISSFKSISPGVLVQLSAEAVEYARANPSLTMRELDDYAVLKVYEATQQQGRMTAQQDFPFLNDVEEQVAVDHKYLALVGGASVIETRYIQKPRLFPGEEDQNPAAREDAFRHVFWNVALVKIFEATGRFSSYGEAAAASMWFTDAHEFIYYGVPTQEYYSANPRQVMLREMDLRNNAWGREWALQNAPTIGLTPAFYNVLGDRIAEIMKDHNQIEPNGPLVIREFPLGEKEPQYAFDCSLVSSKIWCFLPVGYDLRNLSIEVQVRDFYDLPKATTVTSRIQEVVNTSKPHSRDAQWQPYTLEPGTYHAVIEVLDSEGFLVLGVQKRFIVTEESYVLWAPTATLTPAIKKTYDGPAEDCPRLQGVFTIDIKGLFDIMPVIPIDDQHAVMAIDRELIEIIERYDASLAGQKPLVVEAATIRSCNLLEEEFELGFLSTFFDAGTGYTAYVGDTFTNLDNRWEMLAWNRTGVGDQAFCSAFDINYSLTYLDGRPTEPQVLADIAPRQNRPFLARYETLYKETYQNSETADVLVEDAFEVPFLDEKAELFGVEAWGHSVGYEPGCDAGPPNGRLQQQGAVSEGAEPGSQVFEAAKAPWLERQAPRAGELDW